MCKQKLVRILSFLSSYTPVSSPSPTIRPVYNSLTNTSTTRPLRVSFRRASPPSWVNVDTVGCHGSVHFVITPEGKPKFEIRETKPQSPRKERCLMKKRLKTMRAREKRKRNDAKHLDPRKVTVKNKKQKSSSVEERLNDKLEKAKLKEASLIERLKRYEVTPVQGPIVEPHELTGEEKLYINKMVQKTCNYVPVGRRGIFGGVILNMHMHWKKHETVKVICKRCKPDQLEEYANVIARLSGGFPVQTIGTDTIIFYRGRDYQQPKVMSRKNTLSKAKALRKSKFEQALETVRHVIEIVEKELELYHRHMALYDDSNNDNPHTILGHSTGSRDLKMLKDSSVADVRSRVLCKAEAADLACQEGTEVGNSDENAVNL